MRLLLADAETAPNGTCAMISFIQYGLDVWGLVKGIFILFSNKIIKLIFNKFTSDGRAWPAHGGHNSGRKLPPLFAAYFLGNQDIVNDVQTAVAAKPTYHG